MFYTKSQHWQELRKQTLRFCCKKFCGPHYWSPASLGKSQASYIPDSWFASPNDSLVGCDWLCQYFNSKSAELSSVLWPKSSNCCLSPGTVKVMERMFKTGTLCYHTSSLRTCVLARVTKEGQINYQVAKKTWASNTWEQSIILSSVVFWVSVLLRLPGNGCFCDAVRPRGGWLYFPPINYSCFTWQRRSQE